MSRKIVNTRAALKKELGSIRRQIAAFDLVCPGNLQKRMKTCGKPGCPCLTDKTKRHGPYYEWTRRENGVFKNTVVSKDEADKFAKAILKYHKVMGLLTQWGSKAARIILTKAS